MRTLPNTWRAIPLACLICLVSWSGCSTKPPVKEIIPDSHDLRVAITCQNLPQDMAQAPTACRYDQSRVTIDLGYLREIMRGLEACTK